MKRRHGIWIWLIAPWLPVLQHAWAFHKREPHTAFTAIKASVSLTFLLIACLALLQEHDWSLAAACLASWLVYCASSFLMLQMLRRDTVWFLRNTA